MKKYVLLAAVIVLGLVLTLVSIHKKPDVNVEVSPSISNILMDGTTAIKTGEQYIKPGKHIIKASFAGFADRSMNITVVKDNLINVSLILVPDSGEGSQWLINHPEEAANRDGIGSRLFEKSGQQRQAKYPIISDLPFTTNTFMINYGPSVIHAGDDSYIALTVTIYTTNGKQDALDWIKSDGYDPANFEIIYTDGSQSSPDS